MVAVQQLLNPGTGGAQDLSMVGPDPEAALVRHQLRRQAAQAQGVPLLHELRLVEMTIFRSVKTFLLQCQKKYSKKRNFWGGKSEYLQSRGVYR